MSAQFLICCACERKKQLFNHVIAVLVCIWQPTRPCESRLCRHTHFTSLSVILSPPPHPDWKQRQHTRRLVWGFYCLPFFYSPSLFPPPPPPLPPSCCFCAPASADLVPSQRLPARPPAGQRVQKAAKIKKKAVCNKQGTIKTLWPLFLHSHLFVFSHFCVCASALLCVCFCWCRICRVHPFSRGSLPRVFCDFSMLTANITLGVVWTEMTDLSGCGLRIPLLKLSVPMTKVLDVLWGATLKLTLIGIIFELMFNQRDHRDTMPRRGRRASKEAPGCVMSSQPSAESKFNILLREKHCLLGVWCIIDRDSYFYKAETPLDSYIIINNYIIIT